MKICNNPSVITWNEQSQPSSWWSDNIYQGILSVVSGGSGVFHPDPDRLSLDRNPSRSRPRQNTFSGFSMPSPFSVNTIHPDLKSIKVFTRDSVVPIPFLTGIPVSIPSYREKSRDFDPASDEIGIGTVPPDSTCRMCLGSPQFFSFDLLASKDAELYGLSMLKNLV
jgi:hypothetical protein